MTANTNFYGLKVVLKRLVVYMTEVTSILMILVNVNERLLILLNGMIKVVLKIPINLVELCDPRTPLSQATCICRSNRFLCAIYIMLILTAAQVFVDGHHCQRVHQNVFNSLYNAQHMLKIWTLRDLKTFEKGGLKDLKRVFDKF